LKIKKSGGVGNGPIFLFTLRSFNTLPLKKIKENEIADTVNGGCTYCWFQAGRDLKNKSIGWKSWLCVRKKSMSAVSHKPRHKYLSCLQAIMEGTLKILFGKHCLSNTSKKTK
jgi:hypothetical protein